MMIHPAGKGAVITEYTFDLRGMCELEFGMQITLVFDRPPLINTFVDCRAIGPEFASGLYFSEQEICSVVALHRCTIHHFKGQSSGSCLLCHDQRLAFEVCFIHLHNTLKNMGFFGQVCPEELEPSPHRALGDMRECRGLFYWYCTRPTPQNHPKLLKWKSNMREPGV
jgi:hypothetical protein